MIVLNFQTPKIIISKPRPTLRQGFPFTQAITLNS